jgi:tetratricopeptide (TPR) repeat protein
VTSVAYLTGLSPGSVGKYLNHYGALLKREPENPEALIGIGLCYLQTGAYALAEKQFEKVVGMESSLAHGYYYSAICGMKGRNLGGISLREIRHIEALINTAIQIDGSRGEFKLFSAILKRDYYERNGLRASSPSCSEILSELSGSSIAEGELMRLFESVRVKDSQYYRQRIISDPA